MSRRSYIGDTVEEFLSGFGMSPFITSSYSFRGQLVDTDNFDIVPKDAYIDKEIARKEAEITRLEEQKTHYLARIDEQKRALQDEINTLRTRKNKKLTDK